MHNQNYFKTLLKYLVSDFLSLFLNLNPNALVKYLALCSKVIPVLNAMIVKESITTC